MSPYNIARPVRVKELSLTGKKKISLRSIHAVTFENDVYPLLERSKSWVEPTYQIRYPDPLLFLGSGLSFLRSAGNLRSHSLPVPGSDFHNGEQILGKLVLFKKLSLNWSISMSVKFNFTVILKKVSAKYCQFLSKCQEDYRNLTLLYYIPLNIFTVLLLFLLSWKWIHVIYLLISFRVISLALRQSHDCPSASEVTLKDMSKIGQHQITTMYAFFALLRDML